MESHFASYTPSFQTEAFAHNVKQRVFQLVLTSCEVNQLLHSFGEFGHAVTAAFGVLPHGAPLGNTYHNREDDAQVRQIIEREQ